MFEQIRDRLVREGQTFTEESLGELPFGSLDRAWIGDAGAAACSQELVCSVRLRRVEDQAWKIIHLRMHPQGPVAVPDPDLFAAAKAFIEQRPTHPPSWSSLGPVAQSYLLVRCLRSHMDHPGPRLARLALKLQQLQEDPDQDSTLRSMALLMRTRVLPQVVDQGQGNPVDDLLRFRRMTYEFYKLVRGQVPPQDTEVCSHLAVTGYHCSNGCYLPWVTE